MPSRSEREAKKKKREQLLNLRLTTKPSSVSTPEPLISHQTITQPETPSQQETLSEKLSRISESNFFWGGGIAVALAAYAFLLTTAIKFSIILLMIAWTVITISIFRHKFFERKIRRNQLIGNSLISIFIGVILVLTWSWLQPAPNPMTIVQSNSELKKDSVIETQPTFTPAISSSPTISTPLKEPSFKEGIDAVMFTVGNNRQLEEATNLQNGKYPFFIGDVPATLYFENSKPFIDVDLYPPPNEPPVRLRHNELRNRPSQWDINFDDKAIEVVDEKKRPVFQLFYKSPSHIVMYGVFFNGYVSWLASSNGYVSTPNLDKKPYPIKRLFKYPSPKYPNRRAG